MTISDTSDVIILQVKAFQIINGLVMKNNSKVLLDSVLNDFYGKKYSLHGVIYHIGTSAYSGHYICKVRQDDHNWLSIDDSKAYSSSNLNVRESNATPYIVFYKKVEDSPGAFLANHLPPHSQPSTWSNIVTSNLCASQKVNSVCDLSKGTQNLINELKFQALRVEKGKKELKTNLVENFKGKRRVKNKTVSERQKLYRANATPEKSQINKENDRKRKTDARVNLTPEKRQLEKDLDKKRKSIKSREVRKDEMKAFEELDSKADLSILDSEAFKTIKRKCDEAFGQGAEYICDICDQLCFKRNTKILNPDNYVKDDNQQKLFHIICRNISNHICLSCHSKITRCEFPPNAIGNVGLDNPVEVLSCLNDIEQSLFLR